MHILHVIPQFPWFGGHTIIGGHASSLMTLAQAQARRGDHVTILSYVQGLHGSKPIDDRLDVVSLFAEAKPGTARFAFVFASRAARWALATALRFDVVHVHSGFAEYTLLSKRMRQALRRATVHTIYCPIPLETGRWRNPILRWCIRRWSRHADRLVAISRNVADSMQRYGLREADVIPPPVDLVRFHPCDDATAAREELGLRDDDIAVLFVGNAKPQKNLMGALDAVGALRSRHPNLRLIITTELKQSTTDADLTALRERIRTLGLEQCVIQRGIVPDMPRLMQACDVLLAPFLDTIGPSDYFMAALEAMACGKPVVVSATGGMPEVVNNQVGRLIDPKNTTQIAAALDEFISDKALRERTGRAARAYCEQTFDPPHIAEAYRALYKSIQT